MIPLESPSNFCHCSLKFSLVSLPLQNPEGYLLQITVTEEHYFFSYKYVTSRQNQAMLYLLKTLQLVEAIMLEGHEMCARLLREVYETALEFCTVGSSG